MAKISPVRMFEMKVKPARIRTGDKCAEGLRMVGRERVEKDFIGPVNGFDLTGVFVGRAQIKERPNMVTFSEIFTDDGEVSLRNVNVSAKGSSSREVIIKGLLDESMAGKISGIRGGLCNWDQISDKGKIDMEKIYSSALEEKVESKKINATMIPTLIYFGEQDHALSISFKEGFSFSGFEVLRLIFDLNDGTSSSMDLFAPSANLNTFAQALNRHLSHRTGGQFF